MTDNDSQAARDLSAVSSSEKDKEVPDIRAIMARIREEIKADIDENRDKPKRFEGKPADANVGNRKAGEIVNSEELRFLNANYAFGPNLNLDSITSHRPGIIGRIIVKVKRKLLAVIWDLLKDYFTSEREFHANLVRHLNDSSRYVDDRDASNFWELIKKIDYDVTKALERIERISDEQMASLRSSEREMHDSLDKSLKEILQYITELQGQSGQHGDAVARLESVVSGLEGIIAQISETPEVVAAEGQEATESHTDYSYLLLENRFRGSEEQIQEHLKIYPEIFTGASAQVLEIGGGRGELQELFAQAKIDSYCVDIDQAMCELSTSKGLDVRHGDGIAHLRSLEDSSIGGVVAIQVVEHLSRQQLEELCQLCAAKVKAGGRVVFETINPCSMLALSSNYFRDPTHVFPQHPDTLAYTMSLAGIEVVDRRDLSPVPEGALLKEMEVEEFMTPRWAEMIERFNGNINRLNDLLYGTQDYCLIGEVRES